ncbi:MAG: methylmalonyl Co-A mutase-associated GTPase MeaB [Planctomycetota bacterium]
MTSTDSLAAALRAGDRAALARAITLVESRRPQDQTAAEALLTGLLPHTGGAARIGVTGAPGVGKSTFLEALGVRLCAAGRRVAVLAVDPSSAVTGGSILGDKTRMAELSRHPNAFVRPSPGGDTPGGVAARTREALLLCEAAGFDVVLVETIGTGQSETAVAAMVDAFLLLLSPAAGDELQGIKRGVMELCSAVLVHKADGDLQAAAERAAQQCALALRVLRGHDRTPVRTGSSLTGRGIGELWTAIEDELAQQRASGEVARRRAQQAEHWLDGTVRELLLGAFFADARVGAELPRLRAEVAAGRMLPGAAARALLALHRG